eukprot:NP_001333846.1 uncharacterized protein LOC109029535 [Zea mays]
MDRISRSASVQPATPGLVRARAHLPAIKRDRRARHRQEQESTGRRIRSSLQGVSDQIYLLLVPLLSSSPTVLCLFFPFQAYC